MSEQEMLAIESKSAAPDAVETPDEAEAEIEAEASMPFSVPRAVSPQSVPPDADLHHPGLYFNRELGWVDFNWRVLHLAQDERTPLLERVRFLAITASNLDEFVQKRVGGLKRQEAAKVRALSPDGRSPTEQLSLLREALLAMHQTMSQTWLEQLKPALRDQANLVIRDYDDLSQSQRQKLYAYFRTQIYPVLTPLAVDPGRPFPFISNLSLSLAITLQNPTRNSNHFARLKVPTILPRWLPLDEEGEAGTWNFLPIEQLIAHHVGDLFPGMQVTGVHPFRVTRNADIRRDEEEATDLLSIISEELRERRFAPVVRLEMDKEMPAEVRRLLSREMELGPDDIYEIEGLLDFTGCFKLADLARPELKYQPWEPVIPGQLRQPGTDSKTPVNIFTLVRQGDLLVHHPYESFAASVQRLIEEAAADKRVLAIKQTLYRTSDESPIVKALMDAADRGKQVAVLMEVKARFDEANNIEWGQMLENAGVHVGYGLVGLKTHTKATLIVRQEEDGLLKTYCHIGTGNYHAKTARLYTDLGLLTCNPELGNDLINLFHYLTGYAPEQPYRQVMVAPQNMRDHFYRLIQREIDYQERHQNGRIIAKMNGLDDVGIIRELYRASQAGVQIDLIIRGHSRLRPGLSGYSENIRIISILGRFLEHDRIFYFHNNGRPLTFIGSADWRTRNLSERVELITPISEPSLQQRLIQILEDALSDNRLAWDLDADGNYRLRRPPTPDEERDFHRILMDRASQQT